MRLADKQTQAILTNTQGSNTLFERLIAINKNWMVHNACVMDRRNLQILYGKSRGNNTYALPVEEVQMITCEPMAAFIKQPGIHPSSYKETR
jgi:hypothetical protein